MQPKRNALERPCKASADPRRRLRRAYTPRGIVLKKNPVEHLRTLAEDSAEMEEDAEEEEADLAEDESTDRNVGDEAQPDATEAAAVEVPTPAPEEVDLPQGEGAPQELDEGAEEVDKAPAKKKAATRSSKRIRKPKK